MKKNSFTLTEAFDKLNQLWETVEVNEHIQDRPAAIESDQKLEGNDNAVVDCQKYDLVAHSEDEKPLDCKMEKKPLEKPLTEEIEISKQDYEKLLNGSTFQGKPTFGKHLKAENNKYFWLGDEKSLKAAHDYLKPLDLESIECKDGKCEKPLTEEADFVELTDKDFEDDLNEAYENYAIADINGKEIYNFGVDKEDAIQALKDNKYENAYQVILYYSPEEDDEYENDAPFSDTYTVAFKTEDGSVELVENKNKSLTEDYKVGDKIRIIHLEGEDSTYDGREGIIDHIDGIGQLHGTWGGLAVIPGVDEFEIITENLEEDTIKQGNNWVNKGAEGTHGKFKTKKAADAQRKAMFANGYKEELQEAIEALGEEAKEIKYVLSLFGDECHFYSPEDVNGFVAHVKDAYQYDTKKVAFNDIDNVVADVCDKNLKYMPDSEVYDLFNCVSEEEFANKTAKDFLSNGTVEILPVYKNKILSDVSQLEEALNDKEDLQEAVDALNDEAENNEILTVNDFLTELDDYDKELILEFKPVVIDGKEYQIKEFEFDDTEDGKLILSVNLLSEDVEEDHDEENKN